jgi:hypothetical protein
MDCPSLCTNVRRQDRARLGGELDVLLPLHGIYSDCAVLTATIFSSRPCPAAFSERPVASSFDQSAAALFFGCRIS